MPTASFLNPLPGYLLRALLVALFSMPALADEILDRAKRLIDTKDAKAAYELLRPQEARRAGEADFDYLRGAAALDAGDAQAAVFALERVIAVQPGHLQARAELARAYYELGEGESAKREFETVRRGNVPPEVSASIDRFLSAIERGPTRLYRYLEATFGFDSNVNSATGSSPLAVPGLGNVVLGPGLTRDGDTYLGLGAGLSVIHPIDPTLALTAGLSANNKMNGQTTAFDTSSIDGNAGLRLTRGKDVFSGSFVAQSFSVDNSRFRDSMGAVAQWQHNYSETRQASLFTQYSDFEYPSQRVRDAGRWIYGASYAQALGGSRNAAVFGSAYFGREDERTAGVPHLGHKPYGVRVGGQLDLMPDWVGFASFGWEQRRYGGNEPLFNIRRQDVQIYLRVGANWRIAPLWLVTPQIGYTENRSNIALNRYTRTLASLTVRREF